MRLLPQKLVHCHIIDFRYCVPRARKTLIASS